MRQDVGFFDKTRTGNYNFIITTYTLPLLN